MAKGSALRYRSPADMPPSLRSRVEAQTKTPAAAPPRAPTAPRLDAEHHEQVDFISRIRALAAAEPSYARAAKRTYAIPNGGARSKAQAGKLKAEGVTSGVLDLFCSVARAGYYGLYIGMKSLSGKTSASQREWIRESEEEGYAAFVCRGADAAFNIWKAYVDGHDLYGEGS